jgi:3',5'-cyclic AMP phosphodiesterase CpdA
MASRRKLVLPAALLAVALAAVAVGVSGVWEGPYYRFRGFTVGAPTETWIVTDSLDESAEGFRVAVVGDPGTGDSDEYAVTRVMADQHAERSYDALVLLGDLIYPDGDLDLLDETILEPFAPLLGPDMELLPVMGNHDYENGQSSQILQRLGRESSWFAQEVGPVLFIVLDSNRVDDPEQTRWLQETLKTSASTWTIAAMHHPPYSAGVHGSDLEVREQWSELFSTYGVDLALAGHDHDYQRSEVIDGVVYVVSGAGAKTRVTGREAFTAFSASALHYLDLQITEHQILGQAIDTDGRAFDQFIINAAPVAKDHEMTALGRSCVGGPVLRCELTT